ncbi:UNVERIFIED_CONTAM: Receptor-like protein 53 [Sesamum angustifolium]|uniref:Receptor-like protein 53 n=1 Tax=Sesamum angustifolium TaxID=2727405 RepID=A0AAW2QSG6_9LAMI
MMLEKDAQSRVYYLNNKESSLGSYHLNKLKVVLKGVELELVKIWTIFTAIDFSCNNFQGEIPDAIVDFSMNQLIGEIPKELTCLAFFQFMNLSNNQLIGPIPSGAQFQIFSTDSFQENTRLCGFRLNISCRNTGENENVPPLNPYRKDEAVNWDYVSIALGYVVGLGSIL